MAATIFAHVAAFDDPPWKMALASELHRRGLLQFPERASRLLPSFVKGTLGGSSLPPFVKGGLRGVMVQRRTSTSPSLTKEGRKKSHYLFETGTSRVALRHRPTLLWNVPHHGRCLWTVGALERCAMKRNQVRNCHGDDGQH